MIGVAWRTMCVAAQVAPLDGRVVERIEIIQGDHGHIRAAQTLAEMRTDESGAAGDQYLLHLIP